MAFSVHFVGDGGEHRMKHHDRRLFGLFIRDELKNKQSYCVIRDSYILPNRLGNEGDLSLARCNAGGKSEISEAYSIDYFNRVHHTLFTIFETQVQYWIDFKMVDFITSWIDDNYMEIRLGISVTRAMVAPGKTDDDFHFENGVELIDKKVRGLIIARNSVIKQQNFFHSILHIWCQTPKIANIVESVASQLDPEEYGLTMKGSFCILITYCDDPKLYKNYYNLNPTDQLIPLTIIPKPTTTTKPNSK